MRTGVKAASASLDLLGERLRPRPPGLTILLYHEVGGPGRSQVDLPVDLFERQIAGLAAAGSVVTLDRALELLGSSQPLPRPLVVVTFDDGTAGFVDHAVPVLARHGVPATLYLATSWVDEGRSFWDDGTVLSWAALADAVSSGVVDVGSHSHTHLLLDRAEPSVVAADLDRSVALIGEHLGVRARHFAYPKALAPSPANAAVVAERFDSAALAGTRPNRPPADPQRLWRTPVQVADGMRWFRHKVRGRMGAEDAARRVLNRGRYRGAAA